MFCIFAFCNFAHVERCDTMPSFMNVAGAKTTTAMAVFQGIPATKFIAINLFALKNEDI
jgi:hypothetical protein